MKHAIKIALAFLITVSCAWGMDENKKLEEKVKKTELFDFSTLDVKRIEEKTGLDLSEWNISKTRLINFKGELLETNDKSYPYYFFDKKDKKFGEFKYHFVLANARNDGKPAHIELDTIVIEEDYRRSGLSKLIWTKLIPHFLDLHDSFEYINFDISPVLGKYSKNKKTREERIQDLFEYYASLGTDIDKEKSKGIIYLDKIKKQISRFKNN